MDDPPAPVPDQIPQHNLDPVVPGNIDINQLSAVLDIKFEKLKREITEESSQQLSSAVKRAKLAPS